MSNPFPGLRPFEDEEAHLFFGRETQIDELLRRLRAERFIAVVGTSGSGKSSLIRAGLFSALRVGAMSGAGSHWRIATMRPGNDPIGELAGALESAKLLGTDGDAELRVDLAYAILERGALGLVEIVRQMPVGTDDNVLVVVDQFEELFRYAQSDEDTAAAFVRLLLQATAQPGLRLYVVLTMRSDFLGDCATFADLPERINRGLYLVPRMSRDQLAAAIESPVKVAGARIAPRLVNELLNDVGDDPDRLPVLAHALMLTYDLWAAEGTPAAPIDDRHYRETGGLARAIDQHAERLYAALSPQQRSVADKLFAAITELGSDNRGIRRPLALGDLRSVCDASDDDVRAVVDVYRARSSSFLRPSPEVELDDRSVIDISHEALMRGWNRLVALLAREVDAHRTYGRLSDAAELYATGKGALLVDPALSLALSWRNDFAPTAAWAKRYGGSFATAMGFVDRSDLERTRERETRRNASRRRWVVAGSVMVVLLVLTFASIASFIGAQRERAQALVAQSNYVARDATAAVDRGASLVGLQFAREVLPLDLARPDRPFVPAAALALEFALNSPREERVLKLGYPAYFLAYSSDGKRLAVAGEDGNARIYDVASDRLVLTLRGHTAPLDSVAFSPDGRFVATSSNDATARIWNAKTGAVRTVLHVNSRNVNDAEFSPNGQYLVTASDDRTARIWRVDSGAAVRVLRGHTAGLSTATFSRDGSRIVTSSSDSTARIWDARTGATIRVLRGHTSYVYGANYSRSGDRIVTASRDETAIIWDARRGTILHTLRGHTASVDTAVFSRDGRSIVTGSDDGSARIWDAASGVPLAIFDGHTNGVAADFTPDGTKVETASLDGSLGTWRASPAHQRFVFRGDGSMFNGLAYSPDGKRIAAGSQADTQIFDSASGRLLRVFHQPNFFSPLAFSPDGTRLAIPSGTGIVTIVASDTGKVQLIIRHTGRRFYGITFSPDGKILLAGSEDNTLQLRDTKTGASIAILRGHTEPVFAARFSPDGSRIATSSTDGTLRIWSVEERRQTTILPAVGDVRLVSFLRDGKRIFLGQLTGFSIWDIETGKRLETLDIGKTPANSAVLSPDESELAVGFAGDFSVRLFDVPSFAPLAILRGHVDEPHSLRFAPDGRHLASSSADGTVRVWDIPPRRTCAQLLDEARQAPPVTAQQRANEFLSERAAPPLLNSFAGDATCR